MCGRQIINVSVKNQMFFIVSVIKKLKQNHYNIISVPVCHGYFFRTLWNVVSSYWVK